MNGRGDGGSGPDGPEKSARPRSVGQDLHRERRVRGPWRLLVMDRDRATCEAIARTLTRAPDFEVVGRALTGEEVVRKAQLGKVDFVLASVHLPREEVLEVCRSLRDRHAEGLPEVVIMGTTTDPALLLRYLEAGAAGFTSEELSVEGLRVTLRLLARGESVFPLQLQYLLAARLTELAELLRAGGLEPDRLWALTSREGEVLLLLEKGLTNLQIARRLHISEGTVKSHVHEILRKLKVRSRTEAVKLLSLQRAAPGRLVLDEDGFRREP
jgi:DNA-binding NarL/FixJ family response regulator